MPPYLSMPISIRNRRVPLTVVIVAAVVLSGGMYVLAKYGIETFVSDAATRLAYHLRDEAAALRRSGQTVRTFEHRPKSWPDGISGAYRIEITETRTSPRPGHRSIGVARTLTGPTRYSTSYHSTTSKY
jgi:hypothetical protein